MVMKKARRLVNRTSTIEVLHNTGDYSNIKFIDTVEDIPENISLNRDAMSLIKQLQLLEIEHSFNIYVQLAKVTRSNSVKEIVALLQEEGTSNSKLVEIAKVLEEQKTRTYEELINKIKEEVK
jgi:hypothetical protein